MVDPQYTQEELQSEEWRPVVGYEGWYSVSNLGRVRRDMPGPGAGAGRTLKAMHQSKGYLRVGLSRDGECETLLIHVLVARAFIGPCTDDMEVDHVDENKRNPRLTNLRHKTHLENVRHSLGRMRRGDTHPASKVTDVQRTEIRTEYAAGDTTMRALGKRYGVSASAICLIVHSTPSSTPTLRQTPSIVPPLASVTLAET